MKGPRRGRGDGGSAGQGDSVITRARLLEDPQSGARPLVSQDASRVIAAAIRTQSLAGPDPEPAEQKRARGAVDANMRTEHCRLARIRAYQQDFAGARAELAKAQDLTSGWSNVVKFTREYITQAEAGAAWTKDPKWTTWHLPSMHGVPEHVLDATYERRSIPGRGMIVRGELQAEPGE